VTRAFPLAQSHRFMTGQAIAGLAVSAYAQSSTISDQGRL